MHDSCGRELRYLRISVTDRCNFRCVYCRPAEGLELAGRGEILSYEEIVRVARVAATLGVEAIRLTGGEPLVRRGIVGLVERLSAIEGVKDLSMTTNGVRLGESAGRLKAAGLQRVNVSLDTLDEANFRRITRGGELGQVLGGLEAALAAELEPVKVNVVLAGGTGSGPTREDIERFAGLSRSRPVHIRFIEWMERRGAGKMDDGPAAIATEEVWQVLESQGELRPTAAPRGHGPARYFAYEGAAGSIGFIAPLSAPFCEECSRLRLSSTGVLRPCLLDEGEVDLRGPLRAGASDEEIAALFGEAARGKPARYVPEAGGLTSMSRIGG